LKQYHADHRNWKLPIFKKEKGMDFCLRSFSFSFFSLKENCAGSKMLPASFKEKETHWPKVL